MLSWVLGQAEGPRSLDGAGELGIGQRQMVPRSRRQHLPRSSLQLDPYLSPGVRFSCCWSVAGTRGVKPGHGAPGAGRDGHLTGASLHTLPSPGPSPAHSGTGQRAAPWGRAAASSAITASPGHPDPSQKGGFLPSASHTTGCQKILKSCITSAALTKAGHHLQTMQKRIY